MAETKTVEIGCGDALGIAEVADFYATLLTTLAEGGQVELDVSKLERIDAAALQMLYAFSKELVAHGSTLTWLSPSEAFCRSAKLLGLADLMNLTDNSQELAP
ncbi:MAG: STAS domain-containing protein [Proteobacteria bacterium]|nr:STAS domain-containing protein [Pseudomonadota bacterium]